MLQPSSLLPRARFSGIRGSDRNTQNHSHMSRQHHLQVLCSATFHTLVPACLQYPLSTIPSPYLSNHREVEACHIQGIGDGHTCAILCTVAKTCSNTGMVLCGLSCRMQCAPRVQESDEFRSSFSFCRPVTIGTEDHIVQTPGVLIDAEYFPFQTVGWLSTNISL